MPKFSHVSAGALLSVLTIALVYSSVYPDDVVNRHRSTPRLSDPSAPPEPLLPVGQFGNPPYTPPRLDLSCDGSPYSVNEIHALYLRFSAGLARTRALAERFCEVPKPAEFPHLHRCQYDLAEMELLYLFIRAERPHRVLELCSAVGYTSLWVLSAMDDNGQGELFSFDVYDSQMAMMMTNVPLQLFDRWHFSQGFVDDKAIIPLFEQNTFDRVIMDADHSSEFARWYTASVLSRHLEQVAGRRPGTALPISVHDIFFVSDPSHPLTGEGEVVLEWLARNVSSAHKSCMIMSAVHNPLLHEAVASVRRDALGASDAALRWGSVPECSLFLTVSP